MTTKRHGKWHSPYGTNRSHRRFGYCNVAGAHVQRSCGVQHKGDEGPCSAIRLWCPEHGAEIIEP